MTEITTIRELEPGDEVVIEHRGATITGTATQGEGRRALWVGNRSVCIRYTDGTPIRDMKLVKATRPGPALPTEYRALIRITRINNRLVPEGGYLALRARTPIWTSVDPTGTIITIDDASIAEWEPVQIVEPRLTHHINADSQITSCCGKSPDLVDGFSTTELAAKTCPGPARVS